MNNNPKQRLTLTNLTEPQQMRELNRQLTWIWDQLLGGLSMKSLNSGTQETINSKVSEADVKVSIEESEDKIRTEVREEIDGVSSSITQTASEIRTEVADEVKGLNSTISQTASEIRSEVDDEVAGLNSTISQTASQIRSEVDDEVEGLNSTISQTATAIRSEVKNEIKGVNSTITQTASQIQSEVDDVEAGLNSKITQTATAIRSEVANTESELRSEISQTADEINLSVSNIRVGGANLIRASKTFSEDEGWNLWNCGTYSYSSGSWSEHKRIRQERTDSAEWQCCAGTPLIRLPDDWDGRELTLSAYLSSSAWAKVDKGIAWTLCLSDGSRTRGFYDSKYSIVVPGKAEFGASVEYDRHPKATTFVRAWTKFKMEEASFTKASDASYDYSSCTHMFIQFWLTQNGDVRMVAPKLEWGNKVSDWSPAPEDTDAEFSAVRSEFSIEAGKIRSEVSNSVSGLQSQINQTDGKIELAVESVQVGGRNYILGTGAAYTATGTGNRHWLFPWKCANAEKAQSLFGKTLTISFDYDAAITDGSFQVLTANTYQGVKTFSSSDGAGHFVKTMYVKDGTADGEEAIYIDGTWTGSVVFSHVKVEIGNKATDWTPAPEDVQTGNENLLDDSELTISNGWVGNSSDWYARNGKRLGFNGDGQDASKDISANFGEIYITPGSYTVSCYAWQWNLGGVYPTLYFDMHSPDRTTFAQNVMATTLEDTASGGTVRKYTGTLNVTGYTGLVSVRFIVVGAFSQGDIGITEWKLERGNAATDWSPYRETFSAGTNVLITKDEFRVTTPEFNVDITSEDGTKKMLRVAKDSVYATALEAPNVAPRYNGPTTLYVNPNASKPQMEAGNYFRNLKDLAYALNNRGVTGQLIVNLVGEVHIGDVTFRGIHGGTNITLQGTSSSHAKLTGSLNLYYNAIRFVVKYLDIDTTSSGIAVAGRMQGAEIDHCIIRQTASSSTGKYGIAVHNGAYGKAEACELYDFQRSLRAYEGGVIAGYDNKGNCTVGVSEGTMHLRGTQPCASTTWTTAAAAGEVYTYNVTVDQGSKPTTPTITTTTVTYSMANADNYTHANGSWTNYSDEDIRQGYTSTNGMHRGCFWFDNTTIRSALKGKTIKQATLSLYQMSAGRNQPVQVSLEGITMNYSGRTGVPYGLTECEYGVIGTTLGVNQTTTFTIPTKVITDLVAGTINGLMLRNDENSVMTGDDNSYHFARFAGGTTTAYKPVLTVTYV